LYSVRTNNQNAQETCFCDRKKRSTNSSTVRGLLSLAAVATAGASSPDLEESIPRARSERLAIVSDAQARHAIVMANELIY